MNRLLIKEEANATKILCESCDYPAPTKQYEPHWYQKSNGAAGKIYLCQLCSNSYASNATLGPATMYPNADIIKQNVFNTNAILDQLGAFDDFPIQWYEEEEDKN